MKKEELYELLGDIDDAAVEAAGKTPVKKTPLKLIITSAAAVVCVGLFVAVGVLLINNNKPAVTADITATKSTESTTAASTQATTAAPTLPPATEEPTEPETQVQTAPAVPESSNDVSEPSESSNEGSDVGDGVEAKIYKNVDIYYVDNGRLSYETVYTRINPDEIFGLWKQKNGIGSEVVLKDWQIESNGWSEEISSGVGYYHVGDTFILHITVSNNLKNYYPRSSEELLTDSLKQTFSVYDDTEFEDVELVLE